MRPVKNTQPGSGFSLLELLIVSGILFALVSFTWPALRRLTARLEHRQVASDVREVLREARQRALKYGRPQIVEVDQEQRKLVVIEVIFDEVTRVIFERGIIKWDGGLAVPSHYVAFPYEDDQISVRNQPLSPLADSAETQFTLIRSYRLPDGYQFGYLRATPNNDDVAHRLWKTFNSTGKSLSLPPFADSTSENRSGRKIRLVFDARGKSNDGRIEIHDPKHCSIGLELQGSQRNIDMEDRQRIQYESEYEVE
jgi:type II secretory pathway pseudopilin PulG